MIPPTTTATAAATAATWPERTAGADASITGSAGADAENGGGSSGTVHAIAANVSERRSWTATSGWHSSSQHLLETMQATVDQRLGRSYRAVEQIGDVA